MPVPASELEQDPYLRLLILGRPKAGKTTHAIATSPGPVRVLICEDRKALDGARRETLNFDVVDIRPNSRGDIWDPAMRAIVEAKEDAKAKKIKTVVVDPMNFLADKVFMEFKKKTVTKDGQQNGLRAHGEFLDNFPHMIDLLMTIPAHLVVVSHDTEAMDPAKRGNGVVPLMPNQKAAIRIASIFYDVVYFDRVTQKDPPNCDHMGRVFVTDIQGVWGIGCRSLKGQHILPAHVGQFLDRTEKELTTPLGIAKVRQLKPMKGQEHGAR